MARQRFIWPEMWDDPDLASLPTGAHLLYIACFSLADDDGRLDGSSTFLRSQCFPYRTVSLSQLTRWKKQIASVCSDFCIYEHNRREYIAFRNWTKYQKPKYPSPSKLPPPPWDSRNPSRNDSPNLSGNDSPTGWVGLGREVQELKAEQQPEDPRATPPHTATSLPFAQEALISKIMGHIGNHADDGTSIVIRKYATHLPDAALAKALESSQTTKPKNRAAYIVGALKSELHPPAAVVAPLLPSRAGTSQPEEDTK